MVKFDYDDLRGIISLRAEKSSATKTKISEIDAFPGLHAHAGHW